jgi:hypothetical protein
VRGWQCAFTLGHEAERTPSRVDGDVAGARVWLHMPHLAMIDGLHPFCKWTSRGPLPVQKHRVGGRRCRPLPYLSTDVANGLIYCEDSQAEARVRRIFPEVLADVFSDPIACLKEARNGSASSSAYAFVR